MRFEKSIMRFRELGFWYYSVSYYESLRVCKYTQEYCACVHVCVYPIQSYKKYILSHFISFENPTIILYYTIQYNSTT